eukprot:1408248-Prymnesium_polylepis.1
MCIRDRPHRVGWHVGRQRADECLPRARRQAPCVCGCEVWAGTFEGSSAVHGAPLMETNLRQTPSLALESPPSPYPYPTLTLNSHFNPYPQP